MAVQKRTVGPARGRKAKQQQHIWLILGGIALFVVVFLGTVALLGRQSSEQAASRASGPVQITNHPVPASAEPNGLAWGPKNAPITVIEYVDYECPSCRYFALNYEQAFVQAFANSGKVRFEIHPTPLHGQGAELAAQGAYCAAEQNKFWPYHDSLFLNQPVHGSGGFSVATINAVATGVGMDGTAFAACLSSGKYEQRVQQDLNMATANGVTGTPTFVVNGKAYNGPQSLDQFRQIFSEVAPNVTFE
ncbi:MAG: DsbA family protein [Chloroflexaceae bacterium]|jgi:protein-disulfide isomerase|nr:DsbA family protein [Chloroflexaceae bacterium]